MLIDGVSGVTSFSQLLEYALADPGNRASFMRLFADVSETDSLREGLSTLECGAHPQTLHVVPTLDSRHTAGLACLTTLLQPQALE